MVLLEARQINGLISEFNPSAINNRGKMYGKCVGNGYIPELDKCPEEVGEEEGVEEVVADEEDEEEKREMRAHV